MSVEVRHAAGVEDVAQSVQMFNATWPAEALTVEEALAFEDRMAPMQEMIAFVDGELVGSAVAAAGGSIAPPNVFMLITVLPEQRRRGAGTALYREISSWAREHSRDTLRTRAREDDPDGLDHALRHGFTEVGRETGLALELHGLEPPKIAPPDGVEIASLVERPEAEPQIFDIAVECYPDIPGDEQEYVFGDREEWLRHQLHGPAHRPDANFVALVGEDVIGYAKLTVSPARPSSTFHGMTAVRRAWRGRGVAGALKRAQIRWALANGLERLETTNEVRNEPMQRVNLGLGYEPTPGSITLEGPLSP
jgi:mycothiol synthase